MPFLFLSIENLSGRKKMLPASPAKRLASRVAKAEMITGSNGVCPSVADPYSRSYDERPHEPIASSSWPANPPNEPRNFSKFLYPDYVKLGVSGREDESFEVKGIKYPSQGIAFLLILA